jgi:uncharacterized SAM-binding protein YcdF (DUF218 family)
MAGSFLVEDDGPRKADVAVVLGGDEYGSRILTAAEFARKGYVPYVLVSFPARFGVCDSGTGYAVSKGYPATLFRDLPNRLTSTRAEVAFLDRYFKEHEIHKILLVTSSYHTHRAAWLMRQQDHSLEIAAEPAPDPYFTPTTWWMNREGMKTFLWEWVKTVASWMGA